MSSDFIQKFHNTSRGPQERCQNVFTTYSILELLGGGVQKVHLSFTGDYSGFVHFFVFLLFIIVRSKKIYI